MRGYSALSIIRNALGGQQKWKPAWQDSSPKKHYDVVIIGAGGETMAYTIANNHPHPLIEGFGLDRFAPGALIDEGAASGVAH